MRLGSSLPLEPGWEMGIFIISPKPSISPLCLRRPGCVHWLLTTGSAEPADIFHRNHPGVDFLLVLLPFYSFFLFPPPPPLFLLRVKEPDCAPRPSPSLSGLFGSIGFWRGWAMLHPERKITMAKIIGIHQQVLFHQQISQRLWV